MVLRTIFGLGGYVSPAMYHLPTLPQRRVKVTRFCFD